MYTEDDILKQYIHASHGSEPTIVISRIIIEFGIPPHVRGYNYIRESILMMMEDEENDFCITKNIYPEIAHKFFTTPSRVERAIRHAVEISWDRKSKNNLRGCFPDNSERPTNKEFLVLLQSQLRCNVNG